MEIVDCSGWNGLNAFHLIVSVSFVRARRKKTQTQHGRDKVNKQMDFKRLIE